VVTTPELRGRAKSHLRIAREYAALAALDKGESRAVAELIKQKTRVQYDAGFASAKESKAAMRRANALITCAAQVVGEGS
jgi:hypothetical protein